MNRYMVPKEPGWRETAAATVLAAGVAGVVFYFARILLSRETLPPGPPGSPSSETALGSGDTPKALPGPPEPGGAEP